MTNRPLKQSMIYESADEIEIVKQAPVEKALGSDDLQMFIPIIKMDEEKRLVYGIATAELPDKSGEICDYASTKPHYEKWTADFEKASGGKSKGNIRAMHGKNAVGKATSIEFDDENKRIMLCAKIVDDVEWKKCLEGVYTGFSQGGAYVRRWDDPDNSALKRYTARPSEVSLVDTPCLGVATFDVVKSDGTVEMRKFHTEVSELGEYTAILVDMYKIADPDADEEATIDYLSDALVKYSEDAPRDEHGRWTSEGVKSAASSVGRVLAGAASGALAGIAMPKNRNSTAAMLVGAAAGAVTGYQARDWADALSGGTLIGGTAAAIAGVAQRGATRAAADVAAYTRRVRNERPGYGGPYKPTADDKKNSIRRTALKTKTAKKMLDQQMSLLKSLGVEVEVDDLAFEVAGDVATIAKGVIALTNSPAETWPALVPSVCELILSQDADSVVEKYSGSQERDEKGRWTSSLAGELVGGTAGFLAGRKVGQVVGSYVGAAAGTVAGSATANPLGSLAGNVVGEQVGSMVGGVVGGAIGAIVGAKTGGAALATDSEEEKKRAKAKKEKAQKIADILTEIRDEGELGKSFWSEALHPRGPDGRFGSGGTSARGSLLLRATKIGLEAAASVLTKASKSEMAASVVKAVISFAIKTAVAETISHSFVTGLKWAGVQVSDTAASMISTVVGVAVHARKAGPSDDDTKVLEMAAKDLPDVINNICDTIKKKVASSDILEANKKLFLAEIEHNRESYLSAITKLSKSYDEEVTMTEKLAKITNDQVIAKANELAIAAGDQATWPDHIGSARTALEKAAADASPAAPVPDVPAAKPTDKPVEKAADGDAPEDVQQVWLAKDGTPHVKKADALAKNASLDGAATKSPIEEALAKMDKILGDKKDDKIEKSDRQANYAELRKYLGEEAWDSQRALEAINITFGLLAKEMSEAEDNPEQVAALVKAIEGLKEFVVSEIQEDGSAEKSDKIGDLAKAGDELQKALVENETMKKQLGDIAPKIEQLVSKVELQDKQIEALRKSPVPPPQLRVVNKGGDLNISLGDAESETNTQIMAEFAKLSDSDKATLLVKMAQQQPLKSVGM